MVVIILDHLVFKHLIKFSLIIFNLNTQIPFLVSLFQWKTWGDDNNCIVNMRGQCTCDQDVVPKIGQCMAAQATPCFNTTKTMDVKELPYPVPAVKIQLNDWFDENQIKDQKTIYAYDDSNNQFYVVSYEPVPDEVETRP